MERRSKHDPEAGDDTTPRQPGVILEREIEMHRSHDGPVFDGPVFDGPVASGPIPRPRLRDEPAVERTDGGLTRRKRVRRERIRVVVGTLLAGTTAAVLPWLADVTRTRVPMAAELGLPQEVDLEPALAALLVGMAALKAGAVLVAMGAVLWRVGRTGLGAGRRLAYELSLWVMAAGVGLVAGRVPHVGTALVAGALTFDAGVLLLLALAAGDNRLRHGRAHARA